LYSAKCVTTGGKKSPQKGAIIRRDLLRSKNHVSLWFESAGVAIPEQPTDSSEISATDSRLSYQNLSLLSKSPTSYGVNWR